MTPPIVLAEKLRRPEPTGLSRARLEQPLLSAGGSTLDLIVAPPGSGKTTLLARVAARSPLPVAWYRVTADDGPEAVFVAHLTKALEESLGLGAAPGEPLTPMTELLARLDSAGLPPALLILDDLHEISGSAAERALERLVAFRPATLRVVIGSRRLPGINVSRLRLSGAVREIGSDDLRFRSWEVEELFVGVFAEPLSPETAAALTQRTGGWAAALQLFHLATAGRSAAERAQVVTDLGGRSRLIRSYLTRNVLDELPLERRRFLILTSTLGTLNGELCDALLDATGSAIVLDELEQQQMFTSSEDDGKTFRYHEVLRTHLELALVEEYGAAEARQWYRRSATLLDAAGEQRAAVRAYARAEDWSAVARLARDSGVGADAELGLPARMVETDPWLALVEARRRVRTGAVDAAVDAFRQAEVLLDEPEFREACRRERLLAMAWTAVPPVAAGPAHWTARIRAATRDLTAQLPSGLARSTLPADRLADAVCHLLAGDLPAALRMFGLLADQEAAPTVTLLAGLGRSVAEWIGGSVDAHRADQLGDLAAAADGDGLPFIARLARGLQEVASITAEGPDWRMAACALLPDDCDQVGDRWGAAVLRLAGAVAEQLTGGPDALEHYADAARRFSQLDAPVPRLWADALRLLASPASDRALDDAAAVARDAERRGVPGAQAVALLAGARFRVMAGSPVEAGVTGTADQLAGRGGLRPAMAMLLGSAPDHPAALVPTDRPPPLHRSALPVTAIAGLDAAGSTVLPADERAPRPPRVTIRCFGGFELTIDGAPADLTALRPRSSALLRLMSLWPDQDVHREMLIDVLWPDADLTAGTRRLQVAVSSIRQVLDHAGLPGGEALHRNAEAYRLSLPIGAAVDVRDFEAAVEAAEKADRRGDVAAATVARQRVLDLYLGDLLPEDGPADPISGLRERYRLAAAAAASALAAQQAKVGELDQALVTARRAVDLDRYQDLPWRLIADLHEAAGDGTAAERARQQHLRVRAELTIG